MVEKPEPAKRAVEPLHQRPLHPAARRSSTYLGEQQRGAGNEIQLTDAMIRLAETQPFYGCRFSGRTFDCGSKLGFLAANVAFAPRPGRSRRRSRQGDPRPPRRRWQMRFAG